MSSVGMLNPVVEIDMGPEEEPWERADRYEQEKKIATLFDAIAHGDEKHRAWLKQAIQDHFAGKKVQKP